jgi:hypothetical protein
VAGLLGSGLVLSNGRGEHLAVAKAGPFLFNDGLASGDAFQVAIETQPQRPAQDCRVVQGTGTGVAGSTDAPSVLIACVAPRPPPFFHVCDEASCGGQLPVVLRVCPTAEPGCTPSRSTVVVARLDGSRIDAHLLFLNTSPGTPPSSLLVDSGSAVASVRWITVLGAPEVRVESDVDLTFTYYDVAPAWGGTTLIDFVSETSTGSAVDTSFYRHASLEARTAAADLQARAAATVEVERRIAALGSVASAHVAAYFIPSEMATQGEGSFSFGGGLVTVNYGNPGWLAIVGGLVPYASGEFAHEHAHELFLGIQPPYQGGSSCQNEGMADALAYVAGDLPLSNFGPVGLRGLDFEADGCLAMSEMHDVGNCPLWHVLKQGQLTEEFMRGLYHPQHAYSFDSCTLADRRSGDSLLVMYTEAAGGADVRPALDAAGIPHAPTYAESLTALGF